MDVLQHDGLLELRQQEPAVVVVPPEMLQLLRASHPGSLRVAHAPVIDRLQLPKVAYQDHGQAAERAVVRIKPALAEVGPFGLLDAEMHARKKRSADEGDLVDDQQNHIVPNVLQFPQRAAFQLTLPSSVGEDLESRASSAGEDLNAATPV